MPISNDTSVCFRCRATARASVTCSRCHQKMVNIGKHWRVPKKKDTKGWLDLERRVELHKLQYGHSRL